MREDAYVVTEADHSASINLHQSLNFKVVLRERERERERERGGGREKERERDR